MRPARAVAALAFVVALSSTGTAGAQTAPPGQLPPPPPPGQRPVPTAPPRPPVTAAPVAPTVPPRAPVTAPLPGPANPVRSDDAGGSASPVPWIIAALAVLAAVAAWAGFRRRPVVAAAPSPIVVSTRPSVATSTMHRLLEVSRRLTDAAATGDVDRAVVRDAIGLVQGDGAALVRRDGADLTVAAESEPELVLGGVVRDGAIAQVADTGQPIVQVSATEPALRSLPAALVAVPLVGSGRVEAVLVVVRRASEPFTSAERDLLVALAPVAAAAMQTAGQARAAVEQSLVDPLTSVGNRRRFDVDLTDALRADTPTTLCIVDLDHFKAVNDTHGHPAGDALLAGVARLMSETIRPGDRVYRIGGEEFAMVLRATTLDEGVEVAERVRVAVAGNGFPAGEGAPLRATASLGVATVTGGDSGTVVGLADRALYDAKAGGRNRVVAASSRQGSGTVSV